MSDEENRFWGWVDEFRRPKRHPVFLDDFIDRLRTERAWQQRIKLFEQLVTKPYVRGIFQGWDEDGRAIFTRTHAGVEVVRIYPEN